MAIFRQYIAPILTLIIFLIALIAVSARIFLPGDMAAPAPTGDLNHGRSDVTYRTANNIMPNNPVD